MSTLTSKEAESLSYQELKDLLEKKKAAEIDKVTQRLKAVEGEAAALRAQLVNLGQPVASSEAKRGRKPNKFKMGKSTTKKKSGKRGAVGAAIESFVSSKGKSGAHVSEIAKHLGSKPTNVTVFFYAKANRKKYKKVAPATFALVK